MKKKSLLLVLLCMTGMASAAEENMRLEGRMLFKSPELAKPGACVMYREGGAGWILTEPVYWLRGAVVSAEARVRQVGVCPPAPAKPIETYSREEFVETAKTRPCVAKAENRREEQFGVIRFRIEAWETPWAKRAANAGRLYQGYFLDTRLVKGGEIEMPADWLGACE